MSLTLIGKKRGMTSVFCSKSGKSIPCTLIELSPNLVLAKKTLKSDGYEAVKLSAFPMTEKKQKNAKKPHLGQFSEGETPMEKMIESRGKFDSVSKGDMVGADYFEVDSFIDVRGVSKGKGYQGVIKRHGVSTIVKSHGAGPVVRHIGSSGFMTSHGRVHKGKKDSGQTGNAFCYAEGVLVVDVNTEDGCIVVRGGVPGPNGGVVYLRNSIKGKKNRTSKG